MIDIISPLLIAPPFTFGGVVVSSSADLVAAVIARLRSYGTVADDFGDNAWTPKFFVDVAIGQPDFPYLIINDPTLNYQAESPADDGSISFITQDGEIVIDLYIGQDMGKSAGRALRREVIEALTDAPLINDECFVHYFRQTRPLGPLVTGPAVGVMQSYRASISFSLVTETWLTP